jgi:hypothetical protein
MEVTVTDDVVSDAYANFLGMFHPGKTGMGHYFWNFVKSNMAARNTMVNGWALEEDAARRCHLLAGPHWRTVAKIMLAKGHDPYTPQDF